MSDIKPVVLGRVSGLFGVKGWVKVHSFTDPRDAILDYPDWFLIRDDEQHAVKISEGKKHGKSVIVKLAGIDDRDSAADHVDSDICVSRESLPATEVGEHYWTDLEGLQVIHKDGTVLGRVAYLLETGANDVLVVEGDQEILIPYVLDDVIENVDLDRGVINVNWEWS